MTLLELFKTCKLNVGTIIIDRGGGTSLNHTFEISPKQFLNYSKADFKTKDERGNINALTNAKRAIDCQTDKVLTCFGFDILKPFPKACNQYIATTHPELIKSDLPHKLKLLQALGIAPASIIADSRTIRNKLEHYYEKCTDKDVQNAIQLAELFISATDNKLKLVWEYYISDEETFKANDGSRIDVEFRDNKTIVVGGFYKGQHFELIVDHSKLEFYPLLKMIYSFDYDQDVEDCFKELMGIIKHPIPQENIHVTNM